METDNSRVVVLNQWIEFLKADSEELLKNMAETNSDIKKAVYVLLLYGG